jgi:hypothetical protein
MDCTLITEVSSGAFFADDFFSRSFGENVPPYGHHIVCFYRKSPSHFLPLGYVNFLEYEEVILVGGAVTNGAAFKLVDESHAAQIREAGGVYYQLLVYSFKAFAERCEAYFGYVGDERAYEVDIQAGFEPTGHDRLIVNFHKPLETERKEALIAKMHAVGPF